MVLELYNDGDFSKYLKGRQGEPFSESEILRFLANIFLPVFHLNSRDICHRDLKPANLLIKREANEKIYLYLSDFGIAKNFKDTERLPSSINNVKGTAEYLAPEVHLKKPSTTKQDVWAIGVFAYELCTFQLPFNDKTSSNVILAIINDPHSRIEQDYSQELKDLISLMLIKDPDQRPSI